MINAFKEQGFLSRKEKIKKRSNRFLYSFLIIFITGYAIFFSSNLWLPNSYQGVDVTPLGDVVSSNNRNIVIDEWTFSKDQRLMEIIVEIEDLSIDGVHDYTWVVKTKDGSLKTSVVASDDEFTILRAERVPRDWTEASLTMDIGEEDKEKAKEWFPIVIYTNNKIVESISEIKDRDIEGYKISAYEQKISIAKLKMEEATGELGDINLQISECEENIKNLQEKMEYQTESEIQETQRQIDGFDGKIYTLQNEKNDKLKEIEELSKKIELTEKLLADVKAQDEEPGADSKQNDPKGSPQDNKDDNN